MKALKNFRLIVLLILTFMSSFTLAYSFVSKQSGIVVLSLSNANCTNVYVGNVITQIGNEKIEFVDDFEKVVKNLKTGDFVSIVTDSGIGECVTVSDGNIGLEVDNVKSYNIKLSPDIEGLRRTIYRVHGNLTKNDLLDIKNTLEHRAYLLNFQYVKVSVENENLVVSSSLYEDVDKLTLTCDLKGNIVTTLILNNGFGKLKIGNNSYDVQFYDNEVKIGNSTFLQNQTIFINNLEIKFLNVTNSSAIEVINFIKSEDIISTFGYVGINQDKNSGIFYFNLPVVPSQKSIDVLKSVVKNLGSIVVGGQVVLNGNIEFYLDDTLLSSLPIPFTFATQPIQSLSIIGIGDSERFVNDLREKTVMCLNSKVLKYGFEKVDREFVEPKYKNVFYYLIFSSFFSSLLFPLILFIKNKNKNELKLSIVLTQIPIIFGIALITQNVFPIGWIIDIYTSLGIVLSSILMQLRMRFDKRILQKKLLKYFDWIIFIIGFLTLFTFLKSLGLVLLISIILKSFIYHPLLRNYD